MTKRNRIEQDVARIWNKDIEQNAFRSDPSAKSKGSFKQTDGREIKYLVNVQDFDANEDERLPIIENVLWPSDVLLLYGSSGVGKSIYLTNIIGALVNGTKCLELWNTNRARVGLFDYEMPEDELKQRALTIFGHNQNFFVNSYAGSKLEDDFHVIEIETNIKTHNLDVIFLDPLSAACHVENENSPEMREVMNRIRGIAQRNSVAVVVVHHTGKDRFLEDGRLLPKTPRGHSSIGDAVDFEFQVLSGGRSERTRLECTKSKRTRGEVRKGWSAYFIYDLETLLLSPEEQISAEASQIVAEIKSARARLELTQIDFAERLNVSERTVKRWEAGEYQPHSLHLLRIKRLLEELSPKSDMKE